MSKNSYQQYKNKIAFIDRDGVINQKAPDGDYIKKWKELYILPGVSDAIRLLNEHRFKVIVITNQRGVARHLMSIDDVLYIHKRLNEELGNSGAHIDAFYICPHEKGTCHCRKPDIGLFLRAEKDFAVDKTNSWMIGDSITDIQAGQNYGIKTIAIGKDLPGADLWFQNLIGAANFIMK